MAHNFIRNHLRSQTYIPKNIIKHKHIYCEKHLLVIANINEHASSNNYKKNEYYYVLKCNQCDSFIPDIIPGNFNHLILHPEEIDNSYPIITANTLQKDHHYVFSKLIDVITEKKTM